MTETAHSSAESLTIGMIGAGGISRSHAQAWRAMGLRTLVYSQDGAEALAAECDVEVAPSIAALIAIADIVDICTPTATHAELALQAIAAGKDVICEKPLALTAADAREVAAAAAAAGVYALPAHVVRYTAPYAVAQRALSDGALGTPAVARFQREGARPQHVSWFADFAASGGIVMDLMIHDLDQAAWWLGPVETVFAVQNPPLLVEGDTVTSPAELTAHVTLQHVSGAISHCRAVWGPPGVPFYTTYSLSGDEGTIRYDSREHATVWGATVSESGEPGGLPWGHRLENNPYYAELSDFYAAILARRRGDSTVHGRVDAVAGAYAVELAAAALESLRTGAVVRPLNGASA